MVWCWKAGSHGGGNVDGDGNDSEEEQGVRAALRDKRMSYCTNVEAHVLQQSLLPNS